MKPCRWCARKHGENHLCQPAKDILNAMYARGMEGNMPSIEFPEPIPGAAGMLGEGTVLVEQLVVYAAMVPVVGVTRPALIFTGCDASGAELPKWVHPGDDDAMNRTVTLVSDMAAMAIRRAAQHRGSV